jgi:glutamyl-tRNA reductase
MYLSLLSLDFRSAPLALRERVAFPTHTLPAALHALRDAGAEEAVILSTCNRVELIAVLPTDTPDLLLPFLAKWHTVAPTHLADHTRLLHNDAAVTHLLRVASGLESLVPGEMQILAQVKEAFQSAKQSGTVGVTLNRLFERGMAAGRRARQETGIARRPVSISHAAVVKILQHFGGNLSNKQVLLVGSGKMGAMAAHQLQRAGANHLMIANRTLEHACTLARDLQGEAIGLDALPAALVTADAVICATGAPHQVLHYHEVADALKNRSHPLLLIDLAVPRDIDPALAAHPLITLCDIDSLQAVVSDNITLRDGEREAVEVIIEEEMGKWRDTLAIRRVTPTITTLRQKSEQIRQRELDKALHRLSHLNPEEKAVIEALSRGLVNKLLHHPTEQLRAKATTPEGADYQALVADLFALEGGME